MLNKKILENIKKLGISAAVYFDVAEHEFKFDARFRQLCEANTCGLYGRNYMCPPSIGELDACKGEILSYKQALVVETIHELEDSFDFEGMMDGGKVHDAT